MEELRKILPAVFRKHVRSSRPAVVEVLAPLWAQIVGVQLAKHCRPAEFESGTLTLVTECPSWAAQLRQMTEEIRAQVNSYLGALVTRKVRVREEVRFSRDGVLGQAQSFTRGLKYGELFTVSQIGRLETGMKRMAGCASQERPAGPERMEH